MNVSNSKIQSLLITLLAIVFILLVEPIDISVIDHVPIDLVQYRDMGLAAPGISGEIMAPYAFRLLGPMLAGLVSDNIDSGFYLMNMFFMILMVLSLWFLLAEYDIKPKAAALVLTAFMLNRYYFSFLAYDFYQLNDTISITCLWLSLLFLKKGKLLAVLPIALLGILAREILLIWIPVAFFHHYFISADKQTWYRISLISFLLVSVYLVTRMLIPAQEGIGLVQAFIDDWTKIIDPWALGKQFFVANTPLFLLPLLFYNHLTDFINRNPELFVLLFFTFLTTLFGHDYERLMAPAAPFIFIFTGELVQKITGREMTGTMVWIFIFLVLALAGNFYHLWGMVILPDRLTSFVLTLISGFAMALLFYIPLRPAKQSAK